jgi:deoxycytidylate deaminase
MAPECCQLCRRVIINAGIDKVITLSENGIRQVATLTWVEEENALWRQKTAELTQRF